MNNNDEDFNDDDQDQFLNKRDNKSLKNLLEKKNNMLNSSQ